MVSNFFQVAQVAEDLPDPTTGQAIAGLLLMAALGIGLTILIRWGVRLSNGIAPIPAAQREPYNVPLPLAFAGTCLGVLLAAVQVSASFSGEGQASDSSSDPVSAAEQPASEISAEKPPSPVSQLVSQFLFFAILGVAFGGPLIVCQRFVADPSQADTRQADPINAVTEDHSHISGEEDLQSDFQPTYGQAELPAARLSVQTHSEGPGQNVSADSFHVVAESRWAMEAMLVAYVSMVAVRLLILLFQNTPDAHPMLEMMDQHDGLGLTVMILILAVFAAPLVEELIFRAIVLRGLWQHRSVGMGMVVSSVLFAFSHGLIDGLSLLPLSFVLAYTYCQRGSYVSVVLVHGFFNAFNMVMSLLMKVP